MKMLIFHNNLLFSFIALFKKEILHLLRNPIVITFSFLFPIIEMFLLGYLLDITVRDIKTVAYDLSNTQESRELLKSFENSNDFKIIKYVYSDKELYDSIISGQANVGIKVPIDYSKNIVDNLTSNILVLADGSQVTSANETVNVANIIALEKSIKQITGNLNLNTKISQQQSLPFLETRISVLYNPQVASSVFYLPGLLIFDMPAITILLVALAIAVERERGTFEQLLMSPINPIGMLLGKTLPYLLLSIIVMIFSLCLSYFIYKVPINGNLLLLIILIIPYLLIGICLGALVASKVKTQLEAIQLGILLRVIPTLYLSGYIFPIESMPPIFQKITKLIPDSYAMEISRGIILRGAGIQDLWEQALILIIMLVPLLLITFIVYKKLLIDNN